jgi:hypothetical protein
MTSRDRIVLRDFLNQFSDRWPEEFHRLSCRIEDAKKFQSSVLWSLLLLAKPEREEAAEIYRIIVLLETKEIERAEEEPSAQRERYQIVIEEIDCGGQLSS